MALEDDYPTLVTESQSGSEKSVSSQKRMENIDFIIEMDRDDLEYRVVEKQLVFRTTAQDELVLIQYPGKESVRKENTRPWDFRPKVVSGSGETLKDLAFNDIWGSLMETVQPLATIEPELVRLMMVVFYRMAYMVDHVNVEIDHPFKFRYVEHQDGEFVHSDFETEELQGFHIYGLEQDIIERISSSVPEIEGMSFEAFLYYNDLLAWNEDCKFHYRNEEAGKTWIGDVGRPNNLRTHMHVLGCFLNELKWSDFLGKLQRGVASITHKDARRICERLII